MPVTKGLLRARPEGSTALGPELLEGVAEALGSVGVAVGVSRVVTVPEGEEERLRLGLGLGVRLELRLELDEGGMHEVSRMLPA